MISDVQRVTSEMLQDGMQMNSRFLTAILLSYVNSEEKQPRNARNVFCHWIQRGAKVDGQVVKALMRAVGRAEAKRLCDELGFNMEELTETKDTKGNGKFDKPHHDKPSWRSQMAPTRSPPGRQAMQRTTIA